MEAKGLIDNYIQTGIISDNIIEQLCIAEDLRSDLCKYLGFNKNREFALDLLKTLIELRKNPGKEISTDDLKLACYLLGLHQQTADCLLIWEAKRGDFDTFCGIDIQLMAFAGVEQVISYLQTIDSADAKEALQHVVACSDAGDFDNLKDYFSPDNLPWWV